MAHWDELRDSIKEIKNDAITIVRLHREERGQEVVPQQQQQEEDADLGVTSEFKAINDLLFVIQQLSRVIVELKRESVPPKKTKRTKSNDERQQQQ